MRVYYFLELEVESCVEELEEQAAVNVLLDAERAHDRLVELVAVRVDIALLLLLVLLLRLLVDLPARVLVVDAVLGVVDLTCDSFCPG